ncbi:MAG TPA: hypothetical protein PKE16_08655 [Hyphomicrobium sp.]|nr:hypothetical protein [Hyphomicrobium sp.]
MLVERLTSLLSAQRRKFVWLFAIISAVWLGYAVDDLFRTERANRNIRELVSRHDIPIDTRHASPQEILARINESLRRDQIDEAQTTFSAASENLPPEVRARALYNIANTRTLLAGEFVHKGNLDGAAALINVAKSEYRMALKLDPENWDARFNIDVAMRIVRDLPLGNNPDTKAPAEPKKLWTDLPGIPKGLP